LTDAPLASDDADKSAGAIMTITRPSIDRRTLMTAGGVALAAGFPGGASAASGKHFITANNSPYDTLDPHVVFDIGRIATRLNMYDCLVRWVDNPPKLQLWLAEKIDISPDGSTYTVTLKPNATFHDGSPVTADDVVYSIERILALKKGAYAMFNGIVAPGSTKAIDARTVRFTLSKPYAVFASTLSELWIINSKLARQHEKAGDWSADWLARNEAGSGGFKLRRYDPAIGFIADRFEPHFAGFGKSNITSMEFRVVLETASRALGLRKGEFNTTDGYLPQDQIISLRNSDDVQILEQESLRTMYFIFHNQRAPLNDVNLRKALCYAFDYDGFINNILSGSVARNAGIIPGTLWGAPKDLNGYTYDLDKAKQHLAMVKQPMRPLGDRRARWLRSERVGRAIAGRGRRENRHRDQAEQRTLADHFRQVHRSGAFARPRAAMAQRVYRGPAQLDWPDLQQPQHRRRQRQFLQERPVRRTDR
jgi:ABC-type transport system substrate-binding protein